MKNKKNILKMAAVLIGFIGLCSFMAVTWKTYSNMFITMKYPDTYKITDEEVTEDGFDFCCEIKNDDISMVQISIMVLDEDIDDDLKDMALSMGAEAMKSELENNDLYHNVKCSSTKKVTKGRYTGYGVTFSATLMSFPIQGECFMAFSGSRLLALVMQAENASYLRQLNEIAEGMVVK